VHDEMHGHESLWRNDTLASDQIRWRVGMIGYLFSKSTCWPSRLTFDYQTLTKPDIFSCVYEERSLIDVFDEAHWEEFIFNGLNFLQKRFFCLGDVRTRGGLGSFVNRPFRGPTVFTQNRTVGIQAESMLATHPKTCGFAVNCLKLYWWTKGASSEQVW